MMYLRSIIDPAAGSEVRIGAGNLGSPAPLSGVSLDDRQLQLPAVSPPAPALRLGEVGVVGSWR